MPVAPLPAPLAVPQRVRDAGAAVLEVPVDPYFAPNTLALYNQMSHGRPSVNGFSGYMPPQYYMLFLGLRDLDPAVYDAVRAYGPIAVFVDRARDVPTREAELANPAGAQLALVARVPGAELIETNDRGTWYLLPAKGRPSPGPAPTGPRLTPDSVEVAHNPGLAAFAHDGDLSTRYYGNTAKDRSADVMTFSFRAPVTLGGVELDQSIWAPEYSRDLEIVADTDAGPVTLFRGSLVERAFHAWLADARAVPIRINVPDAPASRRIRIISHPAGKPFTWSVGEVVLYAK